MKEYKRRGYLVIDDFLPADVANQINLLYQDVEDWQKIEQTGSNHSNSSVDKKSAKVAKFSRSNNLEQSAQINNIFDEYFKPKLRNLSGVDLKKYDKRCYKLQKGDYYKTHIDDYIGNIGCIYYVNKDWAWDWGGILHINSDDSVDVAESIKPKFNRIIFIDHENFKSPHSVSIISQYAKESRYTMVSFNK